MFNRFIALSKVYSFLLFQIILWGCPSGLLAQSILHDSIATTPEVTVYGNRLEEFTAGVKIVTSDSAVKENFRHTTLSSYLEQNSTIYLKSYGLGSLATTSFRGAGASQTSVLWNGFNLQSPMNGTLDLALLPMSLMEDVKLQYGGSGALWGSGAVSGSIHLDNKPLYGKGWSARYSAGYGSFQNYSQLVSLGISKKRWIVSLKGFYNEAKNNFPFTNIAMFGKPEQTQRNAELKQYGYLFDSYVKLNKRNQLSLRVWQQYSDRRIPASMVVGFSDALQKDWFLRASTEWQHTRSKAAYYVRLAYLDEYLLYQEKSKNTNSHSHSIAQISEAEAKVSYLKRGLLNVGINNTYNIAEIDAYGGKPYQNRSSLFASLNYSGKKNYWKVNAGARKELVVGSRYHQPLEVPIMPFAGADLRLIKKLVLKTSVSRNYRLPTFNDLYWTPGGNINLKPEQGWSEEVGLHFTHTSKEGERPLHLSFFSTFFNRTIDNWILWVPAGSYWVPQNLLKVWSRGLENTADLNFSIRKLTVLLGAKYDYIQSTNERVAAGKENELHKQLIYVPLHKGLISGGLIVRGYGLRYTHQYTGWVFTQADNEAFIDPYWVGNISLTKTHVIGKKGMGINFLFKVNNLWNKQYQVIAYRPMPRRNFEAGISILYNQK